MLTRFQPRGADGGRTLPLIPSLNAYLRRRKGSYQAFSYDDDRKRMANDGASLATLYCLGSPILDCQLLTLEQALPACYAFLGFATSVAERPRRDAKLKGSPWFPLAS